MSYIRTTSRRITIKRSIRDIVTLCRRNLYGIIYYNIIITYCMVPATGLACLNHICYTRASAVSTVWMKWNRQCGHTRLGKISRMTLVVHNRLYQDTHTRDRARTYTNTDLIHFFFFVGNAFSGHDWSLSALFEYLGIRTSYIYILYCISHAALHLGIKFVYLMTSTPKNIL